MSYFVLRHSLQIDAQRVIDGSLRKIISDVKLHDAQGTPLQHEPGHGFLRSDQEGSIHIHCRFDSTLSARLWTNAASRYSLSFSDGVHAFRSTPQHIYAFRTHLSGDGSIDVSFRPRMIHADSSSHTQKEHTSTIYVYKFLSQLRDNQFKPTELYTHPKEAREQHKYPDIFPGGITVSIREVDDDLICIQARGTSEQAAIAAHCVLNAMNVVSGSENHPIASIFVKGETSSARLFSRVHTLRPHWIGPGVHYFKPDDFWKAIERLAETLMQSGDRGEYIVDIFRSLHAGSGHYFSTACTVLSVAIERLVHCTIETSINGFPLEVANSIKCSVREHPLATAAHLDRLNGWLESLKNPRTTDLLHEWAHDNNVDTQLIRYYKKLRNPSVHFDHGKILYRPDKTTALYNHSLALLYLLVFSWCKYDGNVIDYSGENIDVSVPWSPRGSTAKA